MPEIAAPRIDYTNKDYQSLVAELLDVARERLPQWTDHSPNDAGVVLTELFAYMGDVVLYYTDRALNEGFLDTAVERRSLVNLLRLIGYELRPSRPASADITLLFDPDYPETVTIPTNAEFDTQIKVDNKPIRFRYLGPNLSLDTSVMPVVPWPDQKVYRRYDVLPVVQVDQKVDGEIVGSSDGSAGQQFRLAKKPLIDDSLVLRVDEGGGPVVWTRQPSLLHSRGADLHFTLRRDADEYAWVAFGDNRYGHAPRRGFNNITADYVVGGGVKGNVPPGTIAKAVTTIPRLKKTANEKAANGGMDIESVQDAAARAPRQFRSMDRAVTTQDYESHALSLGVGKARARAASWNRIELYIAPAGGGYPTDTLKQDLLRYFEQKRMLTSIVDVLDPEYVPVFIEGVLEVEPYVFQQRVRQGAEAAVQHFLGFDQRRFEDVLYLSKIYEAIEAVPGVNSVTITRFARPDSLTALPESGKLTFEWDQIPVAGHPTGIDFGTNVTGGVGAP
jgi:baseplate J-like protein